MLFRRLHTKSWLATVQSSQSQSHPNPYWLEHLKVKEEEEEKTKKEEDVLHGRLNPRERRWVRGLLAVNVAVAGAWWLSSDDQSFMSQHFVSSIENFVDGRWWTVWTSTVSHADVVHLAMNLKALAWIAPPVVRLLGLAGTAAVILIAPVASRVTVILAQNKVSFDWQTGIVHLEARSVDALRGGLGASGVVMALVGVAAVAHRMWRISAFLVLVDVAGVAWNAHVDTSKSTGIGHWEHLGGFAFGACVGASVLLLRRGRVGAALEQISKQPRTATRMSTSTWLQTNLVAYRESIRWYPRRACTVSNS